LHQTCCLPPLRSWRETRQACRCILRACTHAHTHRHIHTHTHAKTRF
jgi:hypothetical protein